MADLVVVGLHLPTFFDLLLSEEEEEASSGAFVHVLEAWNAFAEIY